ncbi:MAG TPA: nuclear transport factor 2 family protein [Polyangiaceae bacterium]|jgi:ketosteroid isomerase-like protein|nr:nuclear transport factor 2 family protein [Polyangiaceae bacterium]
MGQEQEEVLVAVRAFYAGLEDLISGRGLEAMNAAWHHTDWVTSKHPLTDWAVGWDEVKTTWEAIAQFGRSDRGGSRVADARVHVRGDLAKVAVVFQSAPAWGAERLMCTNVLERIDGRWKVIHHHADVGPAMAAALEKMITGG